MSVSQPTVGLPNVGQESAGAKPYRRAAMTSELTESRRTRYTRRAMRDTLSRPDARTTARQHHHQGAVQQADVNRSVLRALRQHRAATTSRTKRWHGSRPRSTSCSCSLTRTASSTSSKHLPRYIADNRNHLQVLMSLPPTWISKQQLLGLIYSRRSVAEQMQPASSDLKAQMRMRFAVSGSIRTAAVLARHRPRRPTTETVAHIIFTMGMPGAR